MIFSRIHSCFLLLLLPVVIHTQSISAESSASDVYQNQEFDISYVLDNAGNAEFTAPDFSPFRVVGGPFVSSSTTIVNGRRSDSKIYAYRLVHDKVGVYKIPSASMVTRTMKRKSNSLTINIVKSDAKNQDGDNSIELKYNLSDSTIYVGQQFLLDHFIYYNNVAVKGASIDRNFERDRFIVEHLYTGSNLRPKQIMLGGKMMKVAQVSRLAINPLRSGDIEIPEVVFQIDIQKENARRRRGFFSFNSYDRKVVTSEAFKIDVLPLPAGAPENFSGSVGFMEASATVDKNAFAVGQESFITLTLKGDGISEQVSAPSWEEENFQIYDPKLVYEDKKIEDGRVVYIKKFQYLVVPEQKGRFNLALPVGYFDIASESYKTINATLYNVVVADGAMELKDATEKTININSTGSQISWYMKPWVWGVITLSVAGLLFFFLRKKQEETPADEEEARRIIAQRKLAAAKDLLDNRETGKYWETLENALRIYLEEKLSLNTSHYSIDIISTTWTDKKYSEDLLHQWREMINKINLARYAGQDISNMESLYKEAIDWIISVEKSHP